MGPETYSKDWAKDVAKFALITSLLLILAACGRNVMIQQGQPGKDIPNLKLAPDVLPTPTLAQIPDTVRIRIQNKLLEAANGERGNIIFTQGGPFRYALQGEDNFFAYSDKGIVDTQKLTATGFGIAGAYNMPDLLFDLDFIAQQHPEDYRIPKLKDAILNPGTASVVPNDTFLPNEMPILTAGKFKVETRKLRNDEGVWEYIYEIYDTDGNLMLKTKSRGPYDGNVFHYPQTWDPIQYFSAPAPTSLQKPGNSVARVQHGITRPKGQNRRSGKRKPYNTKVGRQGINNPGWGVGSSGKRGQFPFPAQLPYL